MKSLFFVTVFFMVSCSLSSQNETNNQQNQSSFLEKVKDIDPPEGFSRENQKEGSFASYLQKHPLQKNGYAVHYYNGQVKPNKVYYAVLDLPIPKKDLQQCADAVIRLRAEYFYSLKLYDNIDFKLTNGFSVPFSKWAQGYRVAVTGNSTSWVKKSEESHSKEVFKQYLDFVFTYAGTLSLSKSLKSKPIFKLEIGDVFIRGGSPGHAVIVMDKVKNPKGEIRFLLAQSYMPAQEMHVLKNFEDEEMSPWFQIPSTEDFNTPEWQFKTSDLKSWE
ncbi:MAG: DUF4846 domain-containing protein [Leadbetterella sp.]